jgi:hypothetical protein
VTSAFLYEKARRFLLGRKAAYQRVFSRNVDTEIILADWARFCRAHESTGHENPQLAARLDGRREVWLRIQHHLQLSNDELWEFYGNTKLTKE